MIQSLIRVQLFATTMDCKTPGSPVLHYPWNLLRFTSIESLIEVNLMTLSAVSDHSIMVKAVTNNFFLMDIVVKPS